MRAIDDMLELWRTSTPEEMEYMEPDMAKFMLTLGSVLLKKLIDQLEAEPWGEPEAFRPAREALMSEEGQTAAKMISDGVDRLAAVFPKDDR